MVGIITRRCAPDRRFRFESDQRGWQRWTGLAKKAPAEVLAVGNAVQAGIYSDPTDFPTPPVDDATFKGALDGYNLKTTAAQDGSKKAIAERDHQGEIVGKMLRDLAHYVAIACKGDMATFLKSGFEPASTAKVTAQPLSYFIRKIKPGKHSGDFVITLSSVQGAAAYELRWAPTVNGTPGTWTTQLITKTRPATSVKGLTPGTTYTFQVRSFNDDSGFSDWSDPITRVCTERVRRMGIGSRFAFSILIRSGNIPTRVGYATTLFVGNSEKIRG